MFKSILKIIIFSLYISINILLFVTLSSFIYIFNIEINNFAAYSLDQNISSIPFTPYNRESLIELNNYLIENYESYKGYYSNTGTFECTIDNKETIAFIINKYNINSISNILIEGNIFQYNKSTSDIIPIIVGGNYFNKYPIDSIIEITIPKENLNIKLQIIGKINTPIILPEYRKINYIDIYKQKDSLIIMPDYLIDDIIYEYDKEVYIYLDYNININEWNEIHSYLSSKGIFEFSYNKLNLHIMNNYITSITGNLNDFIIKIVILFVITSIINICICYHLFSKITDYLLISIVTSVFFIFVLYLCKNIFYKLLFNNWLFIISIIIYLIIFLQLAISLIITLIQRKKSKIKEEVKYDKI